jgi:hypothetical protein
VFFVRQSALFAQPFDTGRLEMRGERVLVAEDVRTFPLNGRSAFSASTNGVLVYRTGSVRAARTLAWYDRQGKQIAIVPDSAATYSGMSLHSDDRHLMAQIDNGNESDLWMIDLAQGTRSRITSDPKSEGSPVLSPDGRSLVMTAWSSSVHPATLPDILVVRSYPQRARANRREQPPLAHHIRRRVRRTNAPDGVKGWLDHDAYY